MIANGTTSDTTVTVAISSADLVRRWEEHPQVAEQVRRAVSDGVRELVLSSQQMPFASDHRGGIRLMLHLLIARFGFTRTEAQAVVAWYETEQAEQI